MSMSIGKFLASAFAAFMSASAVAAPGEAALPKLTSEHRAVFCGEAGHEASRIYSEAVVAEIAWRRTAGARTVAEALGQMRGEYCAGLVAGVRK